jgi:hypothetical protein
MKKEDVRSEGERPNVDRRRFLGTVRLPQSLSPSPVTVSVMASWHWTRPHVSFGFRFTSSTGPPDVVIRSTCHFPVPRLAARPLARARPAYFIPPPHSNSPSLTLSAFPRCPSTPHVPCSRPETIPLSLSSLGICPCFECSRHAIEPEHSQFCTLSTHVPLKLLCSPRPLSFR